MKPKIIIFAVMPLLVAALAGWRLWAHDPLPAPSTPARPPTSAGAKPGTLSREKDNRAAANYIGSMARNGLLLDESDPAAQNDIRQWEERIAAYALKQNAKAADPARVHDLAVKTASLFRMLKQASARQRAGQEPYTGQSGLDAMALVMTTEKEFEEIPGLAFAEFLETVDENLIKSLAE